LDQAEALEGMGAHIALVGERETAQLGLISSQEGCWNLARAFLGMERDESLSEEDMADALEEIINILAGGVKRRLIALDSSLKMGLPFFIQGHIMATPAQDRAIAAFRLGVVEGHLIVLRSRHAG
jgi:CheY-specific phosphatase CheX